MSDCVREPELEAALDGRLDPEATREVMAHAAGCLRCREARAELKSLSRLARALPAAVPDPLRARRARAAILSAALMGAAPRPRRVPAPVAGAGVVAAAVCFAALCFAAAGAFTRPRAAPRAPVAPTVVLAQPRVPDATPTALVAPPAPAPPPSVATASPASARAPTANDLGAWFREGSFAYARGAHPDADRALGRFLAAAPRSDPRREDARYLRVLALYALARTDALVRESEAYAREFPRGIKRPEVVLAAVRALASEQRCDAAERLGATMPTDAPARLRVGLGQTLGACR